MMSEPVRVLYFVDRMLRGGIQSLVIDWVSRFDKNKVKVDILLLDDGVEYDLEEKLRSFGCNVYKLKSIWINKPTDFIKEAEALDQFFKGHHNYKILHFHSTSKNFLVLKYAKKYGIPIRISHSHNIDFQTKNILKKQIGNLLKPKLIKFSTDYFACSRIAGEWLFGNKIVNSRKFEVIHNAVDYEKFKFNEGIRKNIRRELGLSNNDIVIGHIGRFTNQKNHSFLIDVFIRLSKENKNNYKLLLIGTGVLEDDIKEKVNENNISDKVIFAGFKEDAYKYVQAMDIFVLPSLYEGLGLVLVEAQASGLPCFATNKTIPDEVKINDNFSFLDLDVNLWTKEIIKADLDRVDSKKNMKESGYLIDDVVKYLTDFYRN